MGDGFAVFKVGMLKLFLLLYAAYCFFFRICRRFAKKFTHQLIVIGSKIYRVTMQKH